MSKRVTIFTWIRNKDGKIKGKYILRTVDVHPSFEGIDTKFGRAILPIFRKFAYCLEPSMDGFDISDI